MSPELNQLSKREREVMGLLLEAKSNKEIALALGISERTVEFHLTNAYLKLGVRSRVEAIVKLGKPAAAAVREETTVVETAVMPNNSRKASFMARRIFFHGAIGKMKKRWLAYFLVGLLFGAVYWHYFTVVAQFFSKLNLDLENDSGLFVFFAMLIMLVTHLGVWIVPATLPAVYEYRYSRQKQHAVFAVVLVSMSAVLGYYLMYLFLLAFVGLPHMEHLLAFGPSGEFFWHNWATAFPQLILLNFVKWEAVWLICGGILGLLTTFSYSAWVEKDQIATVS